MEQLTFDFERPYGLYSPDELFAVMNQMLLTELKEDQRLEKKSARYKVRDLGDYFSMWANTAPDGGILIVGVENDGTITGCRSVGTRLNEIEKCPYDFTPDARFDSRRISVRYSDGTEDFVIVFRVEYRPDKVVHTVAGKAFIRRGDSKHELNANEIRELQIDRREQDLEKESVNLIYPDDFNMSLIQRFIEGDKAFHGVEQSKKDTEILEMRRLGVTKAGRFIPNVACALSFAKDPVNLFPGCYIKFLRFHGEEELTGANYNVIKTILIEGPVPVLIEQATLTLNAQLREFSRLGPDGIFYSAPEYPKDAWTEAIVNACIHRSYGLKNMNIFIKMFDDKLVIESPGPFPPLVTPENIYGNHNPRNPTIMRAMLYMGLVKEHGEGTRRMRAEMIGMDLPEPTFSQMKAGVGNFQVKVTLQNRVKQRNAWVDSGVASVLGAALSDSLSEEEKRVINFLAEYEKINVSQCLKLLPQLPKWHAAKKLLTRLMEKGILKHVHSPYVLRDSNAHYVLQDTYRKALQPPDQP